MWDTNALVAACSFALPERVFALGMSHVAAVHCLVAVGSGDPQVPPAPPWLAGLNAPARASIIATFISRLLADTVDRTFGNFRCKMIAAALRVAFL